MTDGYIFLPEREQMQERPVPPLSIGEQETLAHLHYALGRQLRERDGSAPTTVTALKKILREQSGKSNIQPSAYIESLLESLNDDDITPALFWYALDMVYYAPTADNGAFRVEEDD